MQTNWLTPPSDMNFGSDQTDVWRVFLDVPPDSVRWTTSILSADEIKRASRFHFEKDHHRFILSHASLRDILSRYLYQSPEDIQMVIGKHGKPAVLSKTQLDFNLSHSGNYALIAITKGRKVGVDVEKHRHDMEHEKIAHRFFSAKEIADWNALPNEDKIIGFFNCWTRKEAYIKAHGLGLLLPLDSFDVSLTPNEPAVLHATRPNKNEASQWTLLSLDVDEQHAGAVAVDGLDLDFRFWDWYPP